MAVAPVVKLEAALVVEAMEVEVGKSASEVASLVVGGQAEEMEAGLEVEASVAAAVTTEVETGHSVVAKGMVAVREVDSGAVPTGEEGMAEVQVGAVKAEHVVVSAGAAVRAMRKVRLQ